MVEIQKQVARVDYATEEEHPLNQLGLFFAAGLFVYVLLLTYGIDLSPGLF